MKDSINNKHYVNLLLGLKARFPAAESSQKPDLSALQAAMRGETVTGDASKIEDSGGPSEAIEGAISINNSLFSASQKSIRHSIPHSFIYPPSTESGKNFSRKKSGFDYRKGDPPLYSKASQESEDEILKKLDRLLQENEISGLDDAQMKEVSDLQKKRP